MSFDNFFYLLKKHDVYDIIDHNYYINFLKYLNKIKISKFCVGVVQMAIEITNVEDTKKVEK